MDLFFIYKVNPVSVNHYWQIRCINNKPVVNKKKEGFEFKKFIEWETLSQCKKNNMNLNFPLIKKPVKISLHIEYFFKKRPKDIDNILKALIDSLEGILFENDSQIYELYIKKEKHCENLLKIKISDIKEE
jgi:Holliday junction resolvase RusA-like endonuclease